jgi:hypothetical protein
MELIRNLTIAVACIVQLLAFNDVYNGNMTSDDGLFVLIITMIPVVALIGFEISIEENNKNKKRF